jgi:glucan 1,4-alpha-glucosidase
LKKIWQLCLYLGTALTLQAQSNASFRSPNGNLQASIQIDAAGVPTYHLQYKNQAVIQSGKLGIELKDQSGFTRNLSLLETKPIFEKNSWSPVWGEDSTILNEYRGIVCTFEQSNQERKRIQIEFRLFNDGLAFRYLFPNQPNLQHFIIDELQLNR